MNRIYLICKSGREDSYTFVGRESDMKNLVEGDKNILISYPGREKEVYVNFKYSDNPEMVVKQQAIKNKFHELLATVLFFSVPILAIYGVIQLVQKLCCS